MRALLALAVAALAALPATPAPAQAPGGLIAYTRDSDGFDGPAEPTLYVARPDGTGERALGSGSAPSLALGGAELAYTVQRDGAAQLVVHPLDGASAPRQVTAFPDGEEDYGPGRFGVTAAFWSPARTRLALRLMEGSTTTLAFVRPDGGGYLRVDFAHLGPTIAWRDDTTVAVGTDQGVRLVTADGSVTTPENTDPTDVPAAWLGADTLVVNTPDGFELYDVAFGKRFRPVAGATAWAVTAERDVVYSTGTELGLLDTTSNRGRKVADLPAGSTVLGAIAHGRRLLVELARDDGTVEIHAVEDGVSAVGMPAFAAPRRTTALRRLLTGGDLTLSEAASYERAFPTTATPTTAAPSPPRTTTAAPATTEPPATTPPPTEPPRASDDPEVLVAAPGPVDPPRGRSAFPAALPAAHEVSTQPGTLLVNAALALLLMLLVTFPAELFNSTLEEHYDEVRGWFGRRGTPKPPRERSRVERVTTFVAYTAGAALLYGLLDPDFGTDAASLRLYVGLLVGLVVVTIVFNVAPLAYVRRRYRERGVLKVLPGTLVVGVACVLVSRLARFEPGYLYGILGGFAFSRAFSKDEEGRNALVTALGVLVVSALAWVVWQPVNAAAESGDPGLLLGVTDSTLSTVAVGGLEGLVIGLMPLKFLQGYALSRWNRRVWAAVFGVVLFVFVHLLLHPARGFGEDAKPVAFLTWLGLFLGFGAMSVAFWGYFRFRPEPVSSG